MAISIKTTQEDVFGELSLPLCSLCSVLIHQFLPQWLHNACKRKFKQCNWQVSPIISVLACPCTPCSDFFIIPQTWLLYSCLCAFAHSVSLPGMMFCFLLLYPFLFIQNLFQLLPTMTSFPYPLRSTCISLLLHLIILLLILCCTVLVNVV